MDSMCMYSMSIKNIFLKQSLKSSNIHLLYMYINTVFYYFMLSADCCYCFKIRKKCYAWSIYYEKLSKASRKLQENFITFETCERRSLNKHCG